MTGVMHDTGRDASAEGADAVGAVDVAFVARVAGVDPADLDTAALVQRSVDLARVASWVVGLQHANDVELARRPFVVAGAEDPARFGAAGEVVREGVADELAAAERVSARAVQHRLDLAVSLVGLPRSRAALLAGRIDLGRARVLVNETRCLRPEQRALLDDRWAARAERLTASRLRRGLRRAVLSLSATAAEVRARQAHAERRVMLVRADDGMAELTALLPAIDAVRAFDVLTAAARRARHDATQAGAPDDRTLDQLRADVLADVFRHAAETDSLPGAGSPVGAGAGVEIQVHAAATTLLGLDDEPGLLAGYGPVTAAAIRALEPTCRLRRLLVEPVTGKVLDVGRTSYRPTADITRHVRATHPRCTFPSCEQPARRSELDHVLPFPLGPTSAANLRPRCKRHHLLKHHPAVTVEELIDGTTRWHLPTGSHDNQPEPVLPPPETEPPETEPPETEPPPERVD